MSNTFDKLSVLDSFIEEVNSYLPEIEANLERLAQSPGDMEALEETYRRTHTIGGSASMMDFPGLAHVAHGMEDILSDVKDGLATLDQPTIELLQRSLARLYRLVDGIQHGIDENAVAAEDDEDYARYRAQQDAAAQSVPGGMITPEYAQQASGQIPVIQSPGISAAPSLDEMLASFRTPQRNAGEAAWPEEPVIRAEFPPRPEVQLPVPPMQPAQHAQFETPLTGSPPAVSQPSALEMLAGSNLQSQVPATPPDSWVSPTVSQMPPAPRPQIPEQAAYPPASSIVPPVPAQPAQPSLLSALAAWQEPADFPIELPQMPDSPSVPSGPLPSQSPGGTSVAGPANPSNSALFPQVYRDMQAETHALEAQVSSLQRTLSQLRLAASVIEAQRVEFKGFLDGSRDALDRMEDWAGKAMGLNLRNSPEQVRRYLPLSVMWVANNKLKKVLDMLVQMTGGVEGTDEQIRGVLQQMQESIASCGEILLSVANAAESGIFRQETGWTPWTMQVSSGPSERVTFERRGDLAALRKEIEAQLREELRLEFESRPATLAARAELERQIREEVRQELLANQQLHESVAGVETPESLQELEMRLRNEIEIQVRREFLSQLTGNPGAASVASMQQQQILPGNAVAPVVLPPPVAQPVSFPSTSTASSNMGGDFGEEAAEIFRLEAEEHLQTISMHVATLEHAPTNLEPIQGIRRATHTLKGAAGMMGFRAIADLCHVSEDMLDGIMEGNVSISPTVLSLILDTAEALDSLINGKGSPAENEQMVAVLRGRYAELLGEQASLANIAVDEMEVEEEPDEAMNAPVASVVDNQARSAEAVMSGARADLSVRVSLSKLDELVNLFGELLVNRTILEERIQRLNRLVAEAGVSSARLRDVGQRLESRFEAAMLPSGRTVQVMPGEGNQTLPAAGANGNNGRSEPAHLAEFDELELDRYTEFHQLARGLSEGISDMTTLSSEMEAIIR